MFISKKTLKKKWNEALGIGYQQGYLAGQIEVLNRLWPLVSQIEGGTQEMCRLRDLLTHTSRVQEEAEEILRKYGDDMI